MLVSFTFRQFEGTEALKELIQSKTEKRLSRLVDKESTEVRVTISTEKAWTSLDISVATNGETFKATERTTNDLGPTVDLVLDKLERQLEKRKQMIRDKRTKRQ